MTISRTLSTLLTWEPTEAPRSATVDTGTRDENVINHGENAFTANKRAIFMLDFAVEKRGGLIQFDATSVARFGKWNLMWVKVVPT